VLLLKVTEITGRECSVRTGNPGELLRVGKKEDELLVDLPTKIRLAYTTSLTHGSEKEKSGVEKHLRHNY
jgi:hypothetical protein